MNSKHLTPDGYIAVASYLAFLLVTGCIAQAITIKVLLLKENRKKHLTPYLLNIVVANIMVILGSFPTTFVSSLKNRWVFNDAVCRLNGLLTGIGCIAMMVTMTCITIKIHSLVRHKNVVINQIHMPQDRSYVKILTAIWAYSFVAMAPPIVGLTDMELEAADTNCVPVWSPKRVPDKIYIIILTIVAYVIPVVVSLMYLWKTRLTLSRHIGIMNDRFLNLRFGSFKNIYRMSAVAVFVFTFAWLPYGVYVLISLVSGGNILSVELTMVPVLTAKTSVIVNPFIYAIVIPRFRYSVLRILRIRRNSGSFSPDTSDLVGPVAIISVRVSRDNTRSDSSRNRGNNRLFSTTNKTEIKPSVEFNKNNSKDSRLNETHVEIISHPVK